VLAGNAGRRPFELGLIGCGTAQEVFRRRVHHASTLIDLFSSRIDTARH
jgi:hypothetical protein